MIHSSATQDAKSSAAQIKRIPAAKRQRSCRVDRMEGEVEESGMVGAEGFEPPTYAV